MFDIDTPYDLNDREVDSVSDLVSDPEDYVGPSPRVRLNYVKMIYDLEGFELTPDAALASIAMDTSCLILATAGSGKTTLTQLKALLFKLVLPSKFAPGKKMLGKEMMCLVYNKHNVADIVDKHRLFASRLNNAGVRGLEIDEDIVVKTMHSFCDYWRLQYVAKLGMLGFSLLGETDALKMMNRAIAIAYKVMKMPVDAGVSAKNLLSFYNLCKESLKKPQEMEGTDKFCDLGLESWKIETIFERYEVSKKLKKKYDYCELLTRFYGLIRDDQDVLKNIQTYFTTIIADEVQDFTPVMWRILELLTNNGSRLICIGDDDQCIYHFRGASMSDLLAFRNNFNGGKVYTLTHNRRCRAVILNEAAKIIDENKLRFDKNLIGSKDGGCIEFVPYNTVEGQMVSVIDKVKDFSLDDLYDSVICFREQNCSRLLVELLEERKIPYCSLQGALPFSHDVYRHMFSILNALELPYDREVCINLYKVLPCSRNQFFKIYGYDEITHSFSGEESRIHFSQYDYGVLQEISGFSNTLAELVEISTMIKNEPMCKYVRRIFSLFKKYFWNYLKSQRDDSCMDDIFEKRALKFFNQDKLYQSFYDSTSRRITVCRKNCESRTGITVSTFHGLKGLEFKHVFVTFMDNDVFPNFPLIDSRDYSIDVKCELKESEVRLWYVAVTRAIDDLCIYYARSNPSKFVQEYFDREASAAIGGEDENSTVVGGDVLSAMEDFNDFRDFEDLFDDEIIDEEPEVIIESKSELDKPIKKSEKKSADTGFINLYLNRILNSF